MIHVNQISAPPPKKTINKGKKMYTVWHQQLAKDGKSGTAQG